MAKDPSTEKNRPRRKKFVAPDTEYEDESQTIRLLHGEKLVLSNEVLNGIPAGGRAVGRGLRVDFQDGPIGESGRNGAFIEDLLQVVHNRLAWYQTGKFACQENADALEHIVEALKALDKRTKKRRRRGVEGTHTP